jgi:formylglycine-generating enzyme required for sulfatase activity
METWPATLHESRDRYERWWRQKLDGLSMSPWYLPPLPANQLKEANAFKLKAKVELGQWIDLEATDKSGKPCWQRRPDLIDGVIHYDLSNHGINQQRVLPKKIENVGASGEPDACEESEHSEAGRYTDVVPVEAGDLPLIIQVRTIDSDRTRTIEAWLGAQNGVEVWLNGKCVYSNTQLGNGLQPKADQALVELELKEGENQLVLRLIGARWEGFYFSTVASSEIHADPFFDLLANLERDFPVEAARLRADVPDELLRAWFRSSGDVDLLKSLEEKSNEYFQGTVSATASDDVRLSMYARGAHYRKALKELDEINLTALRRAVLDLAKTFPGEYAPGEEILEQIDRYEIRLKELHERIGPDDKLAAREIGQILAFQRRVLLSNPLLDFDELLLIKRKPLGDPRRPKAPNRGLGEFLGIPQQSSWQLDRIRQPYGWDNEIAAMSMPRSGNEAPTLRTLYKPPTPRLLQDIDLHYDGGKILFSMPGSNLLWQVFEMNADGSNVRQLSPVDQPDVHNFDACYLPNDKIVFVSTAPFQGVPCSDGIAVAMAYSMDARGGNIRQLCFDQDHDYCPTVMNDGRILYLRWDYTDLPHQWPRILFTMNPDGTGQREYYGSGSYWPNAIFYARPIPGHPTKVVGIVTGHHVGRVGELVIFDPARGRHEADGVVQRIPGFGEKIEPIIMDKLTIDSWPKFLNPWPLSEKYFLVSCKPTPEDLWGIYLVDTFDNIVLLEEIEGYALFEPIPLRSRERPPVIADRVDLTRKDALLYIENIYQGPGLTGVPKGAVKELRVFTYYFAYPYKSGGQHRVGADGPWEPKRILGTVPVETDGSAFFRVPANTPISMQPLDAEGKALQLMRSWTTAMPGELVSCTGCHEKQNSAPAAEATVASRKKPAEIKPWHGPTRGFSFSREVQPVLDRHCVGCHDGRSRDGHKLPDLRANQGENVVFGFQDPRPKLVERKPRSELVKDYAGVFEPSYVALRSLVRVGGLESDLHMLNPGEFGADSSELIQMLKKGHHGVKLDDQSWARLYAWIDLNAPCHGTWRETVGLERMATDHARRFELRKLYGGATDDPEAIRERAKDTFKHAEEAAGHFARKLQSVQSPRPQYAFSSTAKITDDPKYISLGEGVRLKMVFIPAGEFVMGDPEGLPDEQPACLVRMEKPFWMSVCEITNEQYGLFDPAHDSRHEHGTASFNSERATGPKLNRPDQPVLRISWKEAIEFCNWVSEKTGMKASLPTESQWEYACRAETSTAFSFGGSDGDFSQFANVSDATMNGWATYNEKRRSADIVPRDARFDDGALVSTDVGSYHPNRWGLHDMHGNVWEWTRSDYVPYPYDERDGRNSLSPTASKVVRGGSWYDRPKRCRSSFRLSYPAWRRVFNVGFRVVLKAEQPPSEVTASLPPGPDGL